MPLALADIFSPETRDQIVSDCLAVGASIGSKVTSWQPGQPFRTLLVMVAQKVSDWTEKNAIAARGGLLDYAEGEWLTLLSLSLYRVTRRPAQAAEGQVGTFVNGSTQAKVYVPGGLLLAHTVTGKTYRNTAAVNVAPGATVGGIALIADELGSDSDAAPGMLALAVAVTGCTATNSGSLLGQDEESDAALRVRDRAKLGSLSPNGPKEAYAYVATTRYFDDGTPCAPTAAAITRTQASLDVLTGIFHLYIATASGAPSSQDVLIVDDALVTWAEPWTVDSQADAAVEVVQDVTYQAWIRGSNLTVAQIKNEIAAELARYFAEAPIGGDLIPPATSGAIYAETVRTVIATATRGVIKVALTIPSADRALAVGQVAKLGVVTGTITVVA